MKNLLVRSVTALFYGLGLLICVIAGKYYFLSFFFVLSMVCLHEFYLLASSHKIKVNTVWGFLSGIMLYVSTALFQLGQIRLKFLFFLLPFVYMIFVQEIFRKNDKPFQNISFTILGIIYTVVPFMLYISMAFFGAGSHYNYHMCLGFLFLIWANDTGAFFTGRLFGKHRLLERISPKKTWEGLAGGVLISGLVAWLLSRYYLDFTVLKWMGMALMIICFGTLGDLVESMFKRELDAKDSGNILPGHGGVLDRFDSLLISSPFVFLYVLLLHP